MNMTELKPKFETYVGGSTADIDITSDGKQVVIAAEKEVSLVDLESGETRGSIPYSNTVRAVAISGCGEKVAASMVHGDCFVQIWNASTISDNSEIPRQERNQSNDAGCAAPLFEIKKKHTDLVSQLAFSANAEWVATAGHEAEVGIWDATTGKLQHFLEPYLPAGVIGFSDNDRYFACGMGTGDGRLWVSAVESGKEKQSINTGRGGAIRCLDFAPNNKRIVVGCRDCTVRQYSVTRKSPKFSTVLPKAIRSVRHSMDGQKIFAGLSNGALATIDAESGQVLQTLKAHSSAIRGLFVCQSTLVTASEIGKIKVWDQSGF